MELSCPLHLLFIVLDVSPTYWLLHTLHVITYITSLGLQWKLPLMGFEWLSLSEITWEVFMWVQVRHLGCKHGWESGCGCFSFCFQYCWKVIFSRTEQYLTLWTSFRQFPTWLIHVWRNVRHHNSYTPGGCIRKYYSIILFMAKSNIRLLNGIQYAQADVIACCLWQML